MAFPVTSAETGRAASSTAVSSVQTNSEAVFVLPSLQLLAVSIRQMYGEAGRNSDLQAILHPQPSEIRSLRERRGAAGLSASAEEASREEKTGRKAETRKPAKKKTGRKPSPMCCFLCPSVLPYKCTLITHLQTVHAINRSQSLMYKRVNQGGAEIRRLYSPENVVTEEQDREQAEI